MKAGFQLQFLRTGAISPIEGSALCGHYTLVWYLYTIDANMAVRHSASTSPMATLGTSASRPKWAEMAFVACRCDYNRVAVPTVGIALVLIGG